MDFVFHEFVIAAKFIYTVWLCPWRKHNKALDLTTKFEVFTSSNVLIVSKTNSHSFNKYILIWFFACAVWGFILSFSANWCTWLSHNTFPAKIHIYILLATGPTSMLQYQFCGIDTFFTYEQPIMGNFLAIIRTRNKLSLY